MKKFNFKGFLCVVAALAMILVAIPTVEAKAATQSPVVNGNEVTFNYESTEDVMYLAGAMNGWSTSANPMEKVDGVFTITLTLEEGTYAYKFTNGADGWYADPLNPNTEGDGYGGQNSVVVVGSGSSDSGSSNNNSGSNNNTGSTITLSPEINGNEVTFYYENASANEVYLAGDMNGWNQTADAMTKDGSIFSITMTLEPGTYAYKFVVNGTEWVADPANKETVDDGFGGLNSAFTIAGGASDDTTDDSTGDAVEGGKYTYTIYAFSTDETRTKANVSALWIWNKTTSGEGQEVIFTETEELSDGRTWVKAVVEFEAGAETGLIFKSAGDWTWQTVDLIYANTDAKEVTLYIVDGHECVYTSLDDITIEEPKDEPATEDNKDTEKEDAKDTEKDDTTADSEKKPANPAVIAWIVVAIVVAGAAVAAFFIVKKFTADLPEAEKKDE